MNIEDIRQKYQRDASQTFAQWKDWVRKNKPSQAQAHVVKAVAPNGGNYERVFGGYTDAQNAASDLVSHGYKDVKLFSSVNAGPLKLLRKFKDSADEYAGDIAGAGVIDPNYQFKTNVGKRLGVQRGNGRVMTIQQYGKPQKVLVKKDGAGFSVVTRQGERIYRQSFKTYEDAFKLARKDGFMVVKDSVDAVDSIREKYCIDKRSDVLVYKVFDKNSNVVSQGELGVVNTIPWNDLRSKANSSGKQWRTISVFRKGERKAIDFISNKESR